MGGANRFIRLSLLEKYRLEDLARRRPLGGNGNMKSELAEQVFALIEDRLGSRPTPLEFEMAYQARVAIDRIRFVIKHTEQFAPHTDQMRDASFQLLDALQRLESIDRRFQRRSQGAARGYDGRREIVDAATTHASVSSVSARK
jgi:hypothetical protein